MVMARYRVRPYGGTFDEAAAHRFGLEAANDAPLLQQMGEPHGESLLPSTGSLLKLPQPPVVVLHVKPAYDGSGALVRLLNASDTTQNALRSARASCRLAEPCAATCWKTSLARWR